MKDWSYSLCTHIWVFSVGRGFSAFVRTGLNQGFIIDMGICDDFKPSIFIKDRLLQKLTPYKHGDKSVPIAQTILSHPHSDHISECELLREGQIFNPALLTCPHDKIEKPEERLNWNRVKNPETTKELVTIYKDLYRNRQLPLQTICFGASRNIPNLEYGIYYVRPKICEELHPTDDNKYCNATSIMAYFRHGKQSILFPGDMTPEAMTLILNEEKGSEKRFSRLDMTAAQNYPHWHDETCDQPPLRKLLSEFGLTILVAPHHGLISGYSEYLYKNIRGGRPDLVVISEKLHKKDTDGSVDKRYQSKVGANGIPVEIDGRMEERYSITTILGHHILIVFSGSGMPKVYTSKNPEYLLKKLE